MTKPCSCKSGQSFSACCGEFLSGKKIPATPEQLMRSRYTAYTNADIDYIAATMKAPAADGFDKSDARRWAKQVSWLNLEVVQSYTDQQTGYVEFIATYQHGESIQRLHELSTFHLIDGRWFYVDGKLFP